jgi:hypothetical protein
MRQLGKLLIFLDPTKKGVIYPTDMIVDPINDYLLKTRYNIVVHWLGATILRYTGEFGEYNSTSLGSAGNVGENKWGAFAVRLEMGVDNDPEIVPAAGNAAGYATEALALAAIGDEEALDQYVRVGSFTVLSSADNIWIAGTDAFAGGDTGNPAQTTNFYIRQEE